MRLPQRSAVSSASCVAHNSTGSRCLRAVQQDEKSGEVIASRHPGHEQPIRRIDHSSRFFWTSIYQWPRRSLVGRIGFPRPRLRSPLLPSAIFTGCVPALPASRLQCISLANHLLQRLCHLYSNPCRTAMCGAAHDAGRYFASRDDSCATRIPRTRLCTADMRLVLSRRMKTLTRHFQQRFGVRSGQMCRCLGTPSCHFGMPPDLSHT